MLTFLAVILIWLNSAQKFIPVALLWPLIMIGSVGLVISWFPAMVNPRLLGYWAVGIGLVTGLSLLNPVTSARLSYAAYMDPVTAVRAEIYLTPSAQRALHVDHATAVTTKHPQISMDSFDPASFEVDQYGIFYLAGFYIYSA
ncbi:hypothetical protein [Lactiplantibacillus carotarum]|uniref:hypothetical protein n=1 Tax=Lactiplantibacillus carotarum TaxID=2993456 RepID=UPI00298F3CD5|nr:hypothetical protein [Lactiplantibacillus carotarum]